jgi:TPR repeat protein
VSSSGDEPRPAPKRAEEVLGEETETLDPQDLATLEALEEAGDVETLMTLAAAYETGTEEIEQDPERAVVAYEAASRLGAHEASYWLAREAFSRGIDPEHLERGVRFLRLAADAGHVKGRVFLGNLYELGVHYETDPDKADLWYRSAARAAEIEHEHGSAEWSVAMAELGCVRSIVPLLEDQSVPGKHRLVYLRLVKDVGYSIFLAQQKAADAERHAAEEARILEEAEAEKKEEEALIGHDRRAAKAKRAEAAIDEAEKRADEGAPKSGGLSFPRILSALLVGGGAGYGGFYLHQIGQAWIANPIYQAAAVGAGALVLTLLVLGVKKKS